MANSEDEIKVEKKRYRVGSEDLLSDLPAAKLLRAPGTDLVNSGSDPPEFDRVSPERVVDLLDIFDVADPVNDYEVAIPELDSVIRSLQEEILPVPESAPVGRTADVSDGTVEETWDPCESGSELGYLLEASDDELGLPPRLSPSHDEQEVIETVAQEPSVSGAVGLGEILGFDGQIPAYDSLELGIVGDSDDTGGGGCGCVDFVALDGLFDHESENSVPTWQPERVSAL